MVIQRAKSGKSFESFGSEIFVNRDTLYEWVKVHPKFSDAKAIAEQMILDFYEESARNAALGIVPPPPPPGPAGAYTMTRANGRLLELLLKIHGKQAGFQDDGSNKGLGGQLGDGTGKDTTVIFNYTDKPAAKKVSE